MKFVKNVVEEIVHNNCTLHFHWKGYHELVCLLDGGKPAVIPKVLKVIVDLIVHREGQWLVVPEAGDQSHPVVQLEGLFFKTFAL